MANMVFSFKFNYSHWQVFTNFARQTNFWLPFLPIKRPVNPNPQPSCNIYGPAAARQSYNSCSLREGDYSHWQVFTNIARQTNFWLPFLHIQCRIITVNLLNPNPQSLPNNSVDGPAAVRLSYNSCSLRESDILGELYSQLLLWETINYPCWEGSLLLCI